MTMIVEMHRHDATTSGERRTLSSGGRHVSFLVLHRSRANGADGRRRAEEFLNFRFRPGFSNFERRGFESAKLETS
jgi:hypothetical protein